ncbi:hypothetical protein OROMI_017696 [Orobanche minor]
MASFSSSLSSSKVQITKDQFYLFYNLDRKLFTRLTLHLGCDPGDAAQVRPSGCGSSMESCMPQNYARGIILVNKYYNPFLVGAATFDSPMETIGPLPPHPMDEAITSTNSSVDLLKWDPRVAALILMVSVEAAQTHAEYIRHGVTESYDIGDQQNIFNNKMVDMLNRFHLNVDEGGGENTCGIQGDQVEEKVNTDYKTIFLTFYKGYPISEKEVREFFPRKYGDFFDAIRMQDVQVEDQQPLYAHLLVRSASFIPVVLKGQSKAKCAINGKHVWARK